MRSTHIELYPKEIAGEQLITLSASGRKIELPLDILSPEQQKKLPEKITIDFAAESKSNTSGDLLRRHQKIEGMMN